MIKGKEVYSKKISKKIYEVLRVEKIKNEHS